MRSHIIVGQLGGKFSYRCGHESEDENHSIADDSSPPDSALPILGKGSFSTVRICHQVTPEGGKGDVKENTVSGIGVTTTTATTTTTRSPPPPPTTTKSYAWKELLASTSNYEKECQRRELSILQEMDHPNVVRLVDYCVDTDDPHLITGFVFPLFEHTLSEVLGQQERGAAALGVVVSVDTDSVSDEVGDDASRRAAMDFAMQWLSDLACGLAALHARNIMHRDLKPANILIGRVADDGKTDQGDEGWTWRAVICDLGMARRRSTQESETVSPKKRRRASAAYATESSSQDAFCTGGRRAYTETVVTRWYRAPEVLLMCSYNCSLDIWSLGCIMYEIVQWVHSQTNDALRAPTHVEPLFSAGGFSMLTCDEGNKKVHLSETELVQEEAAPRWLQIRNRRICRWSQLRIVHQHLGEPSSAELDRTKDPRYRRRLEKYVDHVRKLNAEEGTAMLLPCRDDGCDLPPMLFSFTTGANPSPSTAFSRCHTLVERLTRRMLAWNAGDRPTAQAAYDELVACADGGDAGDAGGASYGQV